MWGNRSAAGMISEFLGDITKDSGIPPESLEKSTPEWIIMGGLECKHAEMKHSKQ